MSQNVDKSYAVRNDVTMICHSPGRFLGLAAVAAATVGGVAACSAGGSSTAPTSAVPSSVAPSSTPASSSASSSAPAAAVTSVPGNPEASINGAPSQATLFQLITSVARPLYPVASTGAKAPDGSVVYNAERSDGLGGRYAIDVNVNPKDQSLITISCTSPVGTVDAVRDVCIDLKYSGSNPMTARAWVIAATKKIPAGNTTIRIRNEDLNGLHWVAYLDETGKNLTVGVSTRHLDV